jgi:hypothetical protein
VRRNLRTWPVAMACATSLVCAAAQGAEPTIEPYPRTIPVGTGDDPPTLFRDLKFRLGGAVKLDVLYSIFLTGAVDPRSPLRAYYDPRDLPIEAGHAGHGGGEQHQYLDLHAKETRFFFAADGTLVNGRRVGALVEADFLANPGAGTEVVTNAYSPALRRAYVAYGGFIAGQDWTTFQDLDAYPERLDYLKAPADGAVYVRQPLLRYSTAGLGGDWHVALENAETWVQPRAGTVAGTEPVTQAFATGDARLPDAVVRYEVDRAWGHVSLAALGRQLRAEDAATGGDAPADRVDGTAVGYGISVAGQLPVTLAALRGDDVRFMLTYGEGVGRYVALGLVPDAVADASSGLEPVPLLAGYLFYRRAWTRSWRTNFGLSNLHVANDTALSGLDATARIISLHMNFLYSPVEAVTFGVEFLDVHRYLEDGAHGELHRVQFAARYAF